MTKLYIRGLNIFVVLSQIMNVVGVYEKHFFVVVFYVLKELNRPEGSSTYTYQLP